MKREGEEGVEIGEGIKTEIQADGKKHVIRINRILSQIEKRIAHPPQIPRQRGIITAVADDVGREMQNQRIGENEREEQVRQERENVTGNG